ncbi:MAG: hypothetical protein ACE5G8_13330, partial [Anaerolineae bacterium]
MRQKLPQLILSLGAGVLGIAVVTALFAAAGPNAPAGSELSAAEIGRLHGWGGARAGALSEGLFWLLGVVLVGAAFAGYAVGRGRAVRHLFAAGSVAVLAGVGLVLFSGQPAASAKSDYPDELPNGSAVFAGATFGCDMCHGYSGTSRLSSGTPGYLASLLKPFSTNTAWGGHGGTSTAVTTDIDGDGFSSGEELQDPTGSWVYNAGNNVFNDAAFV